MSYSTLQLIEWWGRNATSTMPVSTKETLNMRSHHLHYSALALALAAALAAAIPARAHAQQVIADGDEQTPVASCPCAT
jgi:hypothetical protein